MPPVADLTCAGCGASNPSGSRFCNGCGNGLTPDQPATHPEAERRLVTVLFSDASGYTQMAESVDAEVVRELMNLVYDKAAHHRADERIATCSWRRASRRLRR